MLLLNRLMILIVPAVSLFQAPDSEEIAHKIKQLASPSFNEREGATKWFLDRPETADFLREALQSRELEVVRRASLILDHFDRQSLKQLNELIKEGALDQVIRFLTTWPKGKHDEAVWTASRGLVVRLRDLKKKEGIDESKSRIWELDSLPLLISGKTVSKIPKNANGLVFIRAQEVEIDETPQTATKLIVASGSVRITSPILGHDAIFAGGSVEIRDALNLIIVSYGDITVDRGVMNSLIIARGTVRCGGPMYNSRIISGKTATYQKDATRNCKITENEATPLGYVRFTETHATDKSIRPPKAPPSEK